MNFDSIDVRQVLSIDVVSDSQVDIVAAGSDCMPTVVSSFTGGEFWQNYPERASAVTFVDPIDPATIHNAGSSIAAPCEVRELEPLTESLAVLCADGTIQVQTAGGAWGQVALTNALAVTASGPSLILAAVLDPSCSGTLIRSVDVGSAAITDLACLDVSSEAATIEFDTASIFFWSVSGVLMSIDGGTAWSVVAR